MRIPLFTTVAASGLSLILGVVLLVVGRANERLSAENLRLQQELQAGRERVDTFNRVGSGPPDLLREVAVASFKDEKIRKLLRDHGYTVSPTPAPVSTPAGTPNLRP